MAGIRSRALNPTLLPLATVLTVAACVWLPTAASQIPPKKADTMINAVIATFPTEPAVVSGQSLMVRTVFDNRGTESIAAPKRTSPSPFDYVLRSQQAGGPEYSVSQSNTFGRRQRERAAAPQLETQPLAGGAKIERFEDVATYSTVSFEPGEYWLTVRYPKEGLESPKSPVTILPLEAESFSSFVSDGHLTTVAAHRRPDGEIVLLHRESQVADPREGVFIARHTLPAGTPVSVATSIDVVPAGSGRWFAWLRDGKLTASNGWGDRVIKRAEPVDAAGVLLSPGFQIAVGTALFGTVTPAGRLETFVVTRDGIKKGWSAELGAGATNARWNGQADGSVTVAWEESTSGRVMRRSFGADGKPRDAAPFAATPGRPLAWGLAAFGPAAIWVVVLDGAVPLFARFPVGGERVVTRLAELAGATAWDFVQATGERAEVAAIANDRLYASGLQGPAWRAVGDAPRASRFHLVSLDGARIYAEWIEAGDVRRAPLP
ncbi:MAG TPA: hypothetical protein VK636_00170 [Gemmatimonadaceae bacterium]|nr:hypothetical protein [Gemmatimonadaceae bacterium]